MNMVQIMTDVLATDAQQLLDEGDSRAGKIAAQVIGEELARASIRGDIKAAAMLMELAGMDFRSRDSLEKHELDRQKLNLNNPREMNIIFDDTRPEQ